MKPRIYIEHLPGLDFVGRSVNLWRGVNPHRTGADFYLGAVHLFTLEEAVAYYKKKLARWGRRRPRSAVSSE